MSCIRSPVVCRATRLAIKPPRVNKPAPFFKTAEVLNSRLAMWGTTSGLVGLTHYPDVISQIQSPEGMLSVAGTTAAITLGSFWTLNDRIEMKQEDAEQTGDPWTPDVEITNGRIAMLGFLALLLTPPL